MTDYLDGPRLAEWLAIVPGWNDAPALRQWFYRCTRGCVTKVWTADPYLIALGLTVEEIPAECYVEKGKQRP